MRLARAYALSPLNKKLLWTLLTLGVVNIGLGIADIYEGHGRGESLTVYLFAIGSFMVP